MKMMGDKKNIMNIKICFFVSILLLFAIPCFAWLDSNDPGVEVVLNTQDNQFAFYNGPSGQAEWLLNNGARSSIRLKGYDDPSGFKWDLSSYAGMIIEAAELHLCLVSDKISDTMRMAITVGFLGALTTFSTFSYETIRYIEDGSWTLAIGNIAANLILGLGATLGGLILARTLFGGTA